MEAFGGAAAGGSFGVQVQVQGIAGRPYVVLNAQGTRVPRSPDYPDVFLMEQRQQEFVSSMSGGASSSQTPPDHYRSLRIFKNPSEAQNCQKNPEILRPYDPRTVSARGWFSSPSSPVTVKRARIPVPGAGFPGSVESVPCQPSHIICRATGAGPDESPESRSTDSVPGTAEVPEVTGVGSAGGRSEVKEETERTAQATPDLLKGQQELPDQPDEEAAKLVMMNYLSDGSGAGEAAVRRQVERMFRALEQFEFADPLQEVQDLTDTRAALESHVWHLQQERQSLQEEREKSGAELKGLQEALERSEQEQVALRHKITDMEKELQTSLDQLLQARRARDQCRSDMRDLQQQLSDIHDELDSAKSCGAGERDGLLQELCVLRGEFEALQRLQEEQEEALRRREREVTALRGALEDEISAHATDLQTLQEEQQLEIQRVLEATGQAKESVALLGQRVQQVAEERDGSLTLISELTQSKAELLQKTGALEQHISSLSLLVRQQETRETQLREQLERLQEQKQSLEEQLQESRQQEEQMCGANRALTTHLEHTQCELSRLTRAHRELQERFEEESRQKEEESRSVFERLQEEMSAAVVSSEQETQRLQEEVDELRDQSHRELDTLHTQLHNTHTQLHTHTHAAQEHQRERCVLEEKLSHCEFDLNEAELKVQHLQKRIKELEENRLTHDDRHYKLMEVRVCELERSVMEERSGSDALMKRLERGREQMEQVRAELLQERAARHDLDCDRIRLERQNKDLRSRVSQLEGSQRSGTDAAISKLQLHVHQLEERLLGEEKENGELQQQNRRLERRMKELTLHLEEERLSLQDQRDQLALRLKTLKRQLDETEEEMERLENSKKKLQRDLEEQQELNEQLHTELCGLRRSNRANKRQTTADDDDDEEDDDEDETEATIEVE